MNEKLNGIFSYLDIDDKTGLASENNVESLSAFQKLFYYPFDLTTNLDNASAQLSGTYKANAGA